MILIDTSIWVGHFRSADPILDDLVARDLAVVHPFVIGELALGPKRQREAALEIMPDMVHVRVAETDEMLRFIVHYSLSERGIGYIDAHLLASALLTPDTQLWSRDRRLAAAAEALGVAARLTH